MKIKQTSLLLATTALVGISALSGTAFAQVEDAAAPAVALVVAPIADVDGGKNLLLTTAAETIQVTQALTAAIGTGTGSAIQAGFTTGATTLTLNNTGAIGAATFDLTAGGTIDAATGQALNITIASPVAQLFDVGAGTVNLGTGVLSVTSSTAATGFTTDGTVTSGGAILDGQAGGAATLGFDGTTAQTFAGDIVAETAAANTGLIVNGATADVTFSGTIGATGTVVGATTEADLDTLTITDGDATFTGTSGFSGAATLSAATSDLTNSGTMTVGSVANAGTVTNSGTLTVGAAFAGAGAFVNSGTATVTGALTATGAVTNSGTMTITGDTSGASTIANTGTLVLDGANNAATVNNAGTLEIGQALTNTGTIDLATTGTTLIDGSAFANAGVMIAGAGAVNLTGSTKVLLDPALVATDVVTIVATAALAASNVDENIANLTVASALNKVTVAVGGSIEATIGAVATASDTAAALGVSVANGKKLNQAGIAGGLPAATQTALNNALIGDAATAKAAAEQLGDATAAAGAVAAASTGAFATASSNIGQRLASLRDGSGVAAGDMVATNNMWFQGTASILDQDARKGAAGYEADSFGGTIGYDNEIATGTHAGIAFAYNYTDVDGDSAANVDSSVDTYLLSVYGDKTVGDSFVNGSVHFGINDVDTKQTVLGLGRMSGDYSTNQYGAAVEVGHEFVVADNTTVVPTFGLNYTRVEGDTVTLRQGAVAVTDRISDKDLFVAKLGARVEGEYATAEGTYMPEFHANLMYDFASDEVQSSRTFTGGTLVSDEQAEIAEESLNIGTSVTFESVDKMTSVKLGYDAEIRDEFLGHTGQVRVSFKF